MQRHLGLDVVLHTHPLATPIFTSCPSVGMVLDVYPIRFPLDFPRSVSLYYRTVVPFAERTKRVVVAISEATRQDAIRSFGLRPEKVRTVHLAASDAFRPLEDRHSVYRRLQKLNIEPPYFAYVGNRRTHKNLGRLLEAYASLTERQHPAPPNFVIAGFDDSRTQRQSLRTLKELIAQLPRPQAVTLVGSLTDSELVDLYNGALFVAIPSLYEGFGLPAIEALATGTPVLASYAGALPEFVGEGGLLVDPLDVAAIAEGIWRLATDHTLRADLSANALLQAKKFTWSRSASELASILEEATR
jgi:glycosyltransferase involved in cell wall biosynthesis